MVVQSGSSDDQLGDRPDAERFIQSTLDAISAHIAILDDKGTILTVNRAWRNFGDNNDLVCDAHCVGTNYLAVCDAAAAGSESNAARVADGIRSVLNGAYPEFEYEYPCHSLTEKRWFVVRASRFDWYDQKLVMVSHQSISELKRVQIEFEQNTRRLAAIVNNIADAILTIDTSGRILSANEAAQRMFGYTEEELLASQLNDLVTESLEDHHPFKRLNGEHSHPLTAIRGNQETFPIRLTLKKMPLDGSYAYTCIVQDVSDAKRAEEEARERERISALLEHERELRNMKNRFLSIMSHELRTPLTSIGLSHDMLKKYGKVSTEEERDQALDNIKMQVDLLSEMVADVMTLSQSESKMLDLDPDDVDLITYCRDILEEFQFNYHKTHNVEFECEEINLRIALDRKLLRRALTNLLTNAIKYSPKGGEVCFYLGKENGMAIIRVTDSGIGIPEADQQHIFTPFHRAENAERDFPGTGLGLAITKQIIELHGGLIGFESFPGSGTTFTIQLPMKR
ncbi:MAG: PAS domain S-box protein [Anaerolineae bacterium]|nr:PAS domain S-box protein [Anaerolineae bacterium]